MSALIRLSLAGVLVVALASSGRSQTPPQTQPVPGVTQTPPRDPKAAKTATGVIRGRVTAADTTMPLRRARLVLSSASSPRPLAAMTDAQGRYEFTELAAGRYTLTASRGSYVTLQYGQRRAFEGGKPIELADGATLEKVDFALPRGGVIAGTVVDELGEPVTGARVTAMRSRYEEGKRKLLPVGRSAETNDLGQYRLYGLQPGTYFVGTQPMSGPLAALLSGGGADAVAAAAADEGPASPPSYYPGTLNAAEAQRVIVRIAQERSGTDFVQLPGRMARLSGIVTDAQGRPQTPTTVMLISPTNIASMAMGTVKPDGSFTIPNVAPGEYMLTTGVMDMSAGQMQMAMIRVTVVGADIDNITIGLSSGARVAGRVVMDDGGSPSFSASVLKVMPQMVQSDIPTRMGATSAASLGTVKDDWTFDWPNLGGSFLFRTTGLPVGYSLKSVFLDGRDIIDTPLDVKGTEDITGLQVVLTKSTTELSGTPTDAKGQPAVDYAVIVFADDAARWKYPSRFVATARPEQDGSFKISNLPPGRYLAVALEYVEEGQGEDPDYLESLRPLATMFNLAAGETKTLALRVTRPGA
jgi:hypothetical protein